MRNSNNDTTSAAVAAMVLDQILMVSFLIMPVAAPVVEPVLEQVFKVRQTQGGREAPVAVLVVTVPLAGLVL
jgi:hypothetical protein